MPLKKESALVITLIVFNVELNFTIHLLAKIENFAGELLLTNIKLLRWLERFVQSVSDLSQLRNLFLTDIPIVVLSAGLLIS